MRSAALSCWGYLLSLWRLPGYFERFSDLYVLGAALLLFTARQAIQVLRLRSQRAVVVDWESTPYQGSELVAWYGRINAIAGREVMRKAAAVRGYARLDSGRLEALQRRFRITHVVFRRESKQALAGREPVFENEGYVVYLLKFKMMPESKQQKVNTISSPQINDKNDLL